MFDKNFSIKAEPHYYPFLFKYAFGNRGNSGLDKERFIEFVSIFVNKYFSNLEEVDDKQKSIYLKQLLYSIKENKGNAFFTNTELDEFALELGEESRSEEGNIEISALNITFEAKRYGDSLAFRITDGKSNIHNKIHQMFSDFVKSETLVFSFFSKRTILVTKEKKRGSPIVLDLKYEISRNKSFAPYIDWYRGSKETLAEELLNAYVSQHSPSEVKVGEFESVPIYLSFVVDDKVESALHRKAQTSLSGTQISLSDCEKLTLRYSFGIKEQAYMFEKADPEIDYLAEQFKLSHLSEHLQSALKAKQVAESLSK